MRSPPAAPPAFTSPGVTPASAPELRAVEVRNPEGELVRKASQEQADRIVAQHHGEWAQATNGRWHVKLKSISAGERCSGGEWMRPATIVRERLQRTSAGRGLTPMFRFVYSSKDGQET